MKFLFSVPLSLLGLMALTACGGGGSTNQIEHEMLRSKLITGKSSEVFTEFWDCSSSTQPSGLLLSFWDESVYATGSTNNGASVEKNSTAAPYALEWDPLNGQSITLISTNLHQQGADESFQMNDFVFDSEHLNFTATDSRGDELACSKVNNGAASFCQFWGNAHRVCLVTS